MIKPNSTHGDQANGDQKCRLPVMAQKAHEAMTPNHFDEI